MRIDPPLPRAMPYHSAYPSILSAVSVPDGNKFKDQLPSELGRLGNLEEMEISLNRFQSTIPTELGDLSDLYWLDMNGNTGITGPVPSEFGRLSNLEYLDLSLTNVSASCLWDVPLTDYPSLTFRVSFCWVELSGNATRK